MRPRFYNINCRESNALDLRQAEAVLKHQPDIIFLEYPNNETELKPKTKRIKDFSKSDLMMWKNVEYLWKKKLKTKAYLIDGPTELTDQFALAWHNMYSCAPKNWFWWVHVYLRERFMAQYILDALNDYQEGRNPTVLVFLQSFHWQHVKFLLTKPSKEKIWKYYFKKFEKEISPRTIPKILQKENKIFYKYWKKFPL